MDPGDLLFVVYGEIGYNLSIVNIFGHVACQCCCLPQGDVISSYLACPLNDVIFCLHQWPILLI